MAIISVPKPPKDAFNKGRPVSGLIKAHLEHLQRAEFRLPANLQTNIYINAIKTEGEAADYIRLVTERLHEAHGREVASKPKKKTRTIATIAAAAENKAASRGKQRMEGRSRVRGTKKPKP